MLTYQDVVEHLITSSSGGPQDAEQKDIRTAVQRAYQEVAWMRDWRHYSTHGRLITQPNWQGTASYATNGRILTKVAGVPFESWMQNGYVVIDNVSAKILSFTNTTTLVLDTVLTFGTTLGTSSATIYQSDYTLPSDFRNLDAPVDKGNLSPAQYVTPDEAMRIERTDVTPSKPFFWTILRDTSQATGWSIKLLGYPTERETIDFTYRRTPRQIRISGHEAGSRAGTVSASGTTTVTGSGSSFAASMVGSILRLGTSAAHPDVLGSMTPFADEAKIIAYNSSTSLTVSKSLTGSAVKYVITDPMDVSEGMATAMLSGAEYWLARIRNTHPEKIFPMFQRDTRFALESDVLEPISGRSGWVYDSFGWRSALQPDGGASIDGGHAA